MDIGKSVATCPICQVPSTSSCSNCLKVVYCDRDHQKQHRKIHKKDCFPAIIKSHPVLGEHLAASRNIKPGEVIFHEQPLVLGPRSNLPEFHRICLGCCSDVTGSYLCSHCQWPLCGASCEKNPWHAQFECPVFTERKVVPAKTQEEYLCVTFLRGLLLKHLDPERWMQLLKFESHATSRNTVSLTLKQSEHAFKFITEKCNLREFDKATVDFVYGIILVNGYGDTSTFAVKLYSKAGKLSHACIPNTRTRVIPQGLDVIAAVAIKNGEPLTQLYGCMVKGTHRRQELLQHVYYFSCSCARCKDPTECGTYFSAVKCPNKKCEGYLLPKNPLKLDTNAKWECENGKCGHATSFMKAVVPALGKVFHTSDMTEDTPLFTEFEIYLGDELAQDEETVALANLQFLLQGLEKLGEFEKLVHRNHYAVLPLKTACIATCHSLLQTLEKFDGSMWDKVMENYVRLTREVFHVINVFLPGYTSERGILLFHLAEAIRLQLQNPRRMHLLMEETVNKMIAELATLQQECRQIMELEPEGDTQKELVFQYLQGPNLAKNLKLTKK